MLNVKELWEESGGKRQKAKPKAPAFIFYYFILFYFVGNDCHFWHLNSHTWDKLKQKHVNRKSYVSFEFFLVSLFLKLWLPGRAQKTTTKMFFFLNFPRLIFPKIFKMLFALVKNRKKNIRKIIIFERKVFDFIFMFFYFGKFKIFLKIKVLPEKNKHDVSFMLSLSLSLSLMIYINSSQPVSLSISKTFFPMRHAVIYRKSFQ